MDYIQRMRDLREDNDRTQQEIADIFTNIKHPGGNKKIL